MSRQDFSMGSLFKVEQKLKGGVRTMLTHSSRIMLLAYSDFKERALKSAAAAVSFYAIFSVFPLLAFVAYLAGKVIGAEDSASTAPMVMELVKTVIPALDGWMDKGIFDVVKKSGVSTWLNASVLAWGALGFFGSINGALRKIPEKEAKPQSQMEKIFFGAITMTIFSGIVATMFAMQSVARTQMLPEWLPTFSALQNPMMRQLVLELFTSSVFVGGVTIVLTSLLYKILIPAKISFKNALFGAILFSTLMVGSRSAYWIYLHYNEKAIFSVYGAFSTLILVMIWVHFSLQCLVYSGLFSYHLEKDAQARKAEKLAAKEKDAEKARAKVQLVEDVPEDEARSA